MKDQVNKWTPGPWSYGGSHIYAPDGEIIAQVHNPGRTASDYPLEANRNVMAAAPELYEALVAARAELAGLPRSLGYDIDSLPMIDAVLKKARGAQ